MPGIAGDTGDTDVSEMIGQMRYTDKYSRKKSVEIFSNSGNIGFGTIFNENSTECYVLKEGPRAGIIDGFAYTDTEYEDKNELNNLNRFQIPAYNF